MRSLFLAPLLLTCIAFSLFADDHLVYKRVAFLAGKYPPTKQLEIWLSKDRACVNEGNLITIYRLDLKRVFIYRPRGEKYLECQLSDTLQLLASRPPDIIYEWSIKDAKKDTIRDNLSLHRYLLTGDAEAYEVRADVWLASMPAGDVARYCNSHFKPFFYLPVPTWKALTDSIALFQSRVIGEVRWSAMASGNQLGGDEFLLLEHKEAQAPQGTYEPPKNGRRIESYEELFQ